MKNKQLQRCRLRRLSSKNQVVLSEVAFKAGSKAAEARAKVAKESRALLGKAIQVCCITDARARASGVCAHAQATLNISLGELRGAKQACEEVIKDSGLIDTLPGDGTLKHIKAIITKATRSSAFLISSCGK